MLRTSNKTDNSPKDSEETSAVVLLAREILHFLKIDMEVSQRKGSLKSHPFLSFNKLLFALAELYTDHCILDVYYWS